MTILKQLEDNVANKAIIINEINLALSRSALFGRKSTMATGLTFYSYGGNYKKKDGTFIEINDLSIVCDTAQTNYISYDETTNTLVKSNTDFLTDERVAIVTADAYNITSYKDARQQNISGGSGGGSSTKDYKTNFDIEITDKSNSTPSFKILSGTTYRRFGFSNNSNLAQNNLNYNEYNLSIDFTSFSSMSTYYVLYQIDLNSIKTIKSDNLNQYSNSQQSFIILYLIKTSFNDYEVFDLRSENIYLKSKVFFRQIEMFNTTKKYQFFSLPTQNQTATRYDNGNNLMSTFGLISNYHIELVVKNAVHNYNIGDTVKGYLTGDANYLGSMPSSIDSNGTLTVGFGNIFKIFNMTTLQYEDANLSDFFLVVKYYPDYH